MEPDVARAVDSIGVWLRSPAQAELELAPFFVQFAERLCAEGVPVSRLLTGLWTRHPEIAILGGMWDRRFGAVTREMTHAEYDHEMRQPGPFVPLVVGAAVEVRHRLLPEASLPFPMLERLRSEGFTDYFATIPRPFPGPVSFASSAPGGFSESHLEVIRSVMPTLGLVLEVRSLDYAMRSLLGVYLGQDAARRVLAGQVSRGAGDQIRAAVWFCDMRGFTELSDRAAPADVARVLDRVFEGVGGAVQPRGGHILKFIGDAVLAVFPLEDDAPAAARRALEAAHEALSSVSQVQFDDRRVSIGVALHVGEVFYGNVGAQRRLDFTVIGATVNEVCRIEAMCKPLGRSLLCSEAFADTVGRTVFEDLGSHALKGVSRPVALFAPRGGAGA